MIEKPSLITSGIEFSLRVLWSSLLSQSAGLLNSHKSRKLNSFYFFRYLIFYELYYNICILNNDLESIKNCEYMK